MNIVENIIGADDFNEYLSETINEVNYEITNSELIDYHVDDKTLEFKITVDYLNQKDELFIQMNNDESNPSFKTIEHNDLLEEEIKRDKLNFDIDYWSYNITYDQLARLYNRGKILIPDMQRGFVWEHVQASKLIESIFMGLPLPSLFLIKQIDGNYLVVDGLQRITTISHFKENMNLPNYPKHSGFKLKGVNEQINNKTYKQITEVRPDLIDLFEMGTINIIEFKQNKPTFEESMYFLFERLNSGGTILSTQQIRNSVSYGPFNQKLNEFSKEHIGRFFSSKANEKLIPSEIILRTISIFNFIKKYNIEINDITDNVPESVPKSIVYKNLLNETAEHYHMEYKKVERTWISESTNFSEPINPNELNERFRESDKGIKLYEEIDSEFRKIYSAIKFVTDIFGEDSFKRVEDNKFTSRSTAIMVESVIVSIMLNIDKIDQADDKGEMKRRYKELVEDKYDDYFRQGTGQTKNIIGRIKTMKRVFFDD